MLSSVRIRRSTLLAVLSTVCLLASFLVAHPARAADPTLGSGNNNLGIVSPMSITAVNPALGSGSELVAANFAATQIRAVVTASHGEVSLTTTAGLTAPTGYPPDFTGPSIAFSGAVPAVNAGLASLSYHADAVPGAATIAVAASFNDPGYAYNPDNGHFYRFVPSPTRTWEDARAAATASIYAGMQGYLATITSAAENAFVTSKTGGSPAWIGGSDAASSDHWTWMDGPEALILFWQPDCGRGLRGTCPETGMLSNWNADEPNNAGPGETALQILAGGTGLWNDLPAQSTSSLLPSIIEYSTPSGAPNPAVSAARTLTVTVAGPPDAPPALSAQPTDGRVALAWNAPTSESPITAYTVQYRTLGGSWLPWPHGSTERTATVTGLLNGTTYEFRVAATSAFGTGPFSNAVAATPLAVPGVPGGLSVTPLTGGMTCHWNAPPSASPVTGYVVEYATATGAWQRWPHQGTATSATITGLTDGTTYRCRVAAISAMGTGSFSAAKEGTPQALPDAPTGGAATAGDGAVVLTWRAPTTGAPVTDYVVQYATETGAWMVWPHGSTATTATITGLANGTKYRFRVAAVSAVGTGAFSVVWTGTPKASNPTAPPLLAPVARKVQPLTWLQVIEKQGRPRAALHSATPRTCFAVDGKVFFLYHGTCTLRVVQDARVIKRISVKVTGKAKRSNARQQRIRSVFFAGDSAVLTKATKRRLLRIVPTLHRQDPVLVLGNAADASGTKDSAQARALSRQRAKAVADFLRTHRVRAIQTMFFSKRYARGLKNPDDRRVDVSWG